MFAFVTLHLTFTDKKAPRPIGRLLKPIPLHTIIELRTQCQLTDIQCQVDGSPPPPFLLPLFYNYIPILPTITAVSYRGEPGCLFLIESSTISWDKYSSWLTPRITPNVSHPCHHSKTTCLWVHVCVCVRVCAFSSDTFIPTHSSPTSLHHGSCLYVSVILGWPGGLCQQLVWVSDDITACI